MKKILLSLVIFTFLIPTITFADQWVNGYYRSSGTYVNGYYRSSPDGNPYNNYSYPGNYNPYTGKTATGNADTYLRNYYDNSSYSSSYSVPSYDYSYSNYLTPSYSVPSYLSTYSSPSYSGSYSAGSSYSSSLENIDGGYKIGDSIYCNTGYYKKNKQCLKAPDNSTVYGSENFYCNTGYTKTENACIRQEKENATLVGSTFSCNSGSISYGGRCVNYETYCRAKYGEEYFYYQPKDNCASCPSGSVYNQNTSQCQTREQTEIEKNKILQEQVNARLNRKTQNLAR